MAPSRPTGALRQPPWGLSGSRSFFSSISSYHIRLINDLSTASITQHKTYTLVNDNIPNVITLNSYDGEQVWTQNVIDIILLLCPFSDCCMSLRCNNKTT